MHNRAVPNKRLRYQREFRGWSRSYVAEQIGNDVKTLARWERGETFPSPYYRQKLCELFQMDAETLGLMRDECCQEHEQCSDIPREDITAVEKHEQLAYSTEEKIPPPAFIMSGRLQFTFHSKQISLSVTVLIFALIVFASVLMCTTRWTT